jgi:hypothetical protein
MAPTAKTPDQPDDAPSTKAPAIAPPAPTTRPTEAVRVLDSEAVAATKGLDEGTPGGKTIRADGTLQNANGMDIDHDGTVLDTPANRERNAQRFSGVPL